MRLLAKSDKNDCYKIAAGESNFDLAFVGCKPVFQSSQLILSLSDYINYHHVNIVVAYDNPSICNFIDITAKTHYFHFTDFPTSNVILEECSTPNLSTGAGVLYLECLCTFAIAHTSGFRIDKAGNTICIKYVEQTKFDLLFAKIGSIKLSVSQAILHDNLSGEAANFLRLIGNDNKKSYIHNDISHQLVTKEHHVKSLLTLENKLRYCDSSSINFRTIKTQINNEKRMIKEFEKYISQLLTSSQNIENCSTNSMSLQNILSLEEVEDVYTMFTCNNVLIVETKPISFSYKCKQYCIGKNFISLRIVDGILKVIIANNHSLKHKTHPHVYNNCEPCMGVMQDVYTKALKKYDIYEVILLIIDLLSTYHEFGARYLAESGGYQVRSIFYEKIMGLNPLSNY